MFSRHVVHSLTRYCDGELAAAEAQRIEARQGLTDEIGLACLAQRLDRGDDAAAGARDFFIGSAVEAEFEFMGAVAGMDQMGVAVDQPGRDPAAFAIHDIGIR